MKSPEFFDLKKFHYTVKRKVSLENGKEVLCYIPVFGDNFDFEENQVRIFFHFIKFNEKTRKKM